MTRRRGQALVEFALILPLLMLIMLATVDLGRAVYAYNSVANAAREAVRTAIINQDWQTIRDRASQQATGLGIKTTEPSDKCPTPGSPTLDSDGGTCIWFRTADLSDNCTPAEINCNAVVSVAWPYHPLTPIVGNIVGTITISATSTEAIENVCPRSGVPLSDCQTR